jgi:hypothetical protein
MQYLAQNEVDSADTARIEALLLYYRDLHYDYRSIERLFSANIPGSVRLLAKALPHFRNADTVSRLLPQLLADEDEALPQKGELIYSLFENFLASRDSIDPRTKRHIWHRYDCAFSRLGDQELIDRVLKRVEEPDEIANLTHCLKLAWQKKL